MKNLFIFSFLSLSFFLMKGQNAGMTEKNDNKIFLPLLYSNSLSSGFCSAPSDSLVDFLSHPTSQDRGIIQPAPLPKYARENPAGHSYLCRLEVKIEKSLPVGLWMKVGDSAGIVNSTGNNAHFRLLKRF
ncbi:MAG: hypothetical protein KDE26_13580 [Bacteroidetes bacterium]|nr:hypothetical protein [Bacteroidota bacterium]